ncbi:MAG: preprotein translocase subunit SecE [Ruminococcaceae bacterium]|jgi:preprotein translocase subunit SecE|nr:preprotein translocase subunit SecE [Oscillospiraceae bacterium]
MSEQNNKNLPQKAEKTQAEKPGFFTRVGKSISKWFRDFRSECKKIVWPTKKQVINNTIVVIVVAIIVSLFVYVLDVSFGFVRDTIVRLL